MNFIKWKYLFIGMIIGILSLSFMTYAYTTQSGKIGSLFEKISINSGDDYQGEYRLNGKNIKDNTIDNGEINNDSDYLVKSISLGDYNTKVGKGYNNSLVISTTNGYLEIGPQNSTYSHFYTDKGKYFFNKGLFVNEGIISSYDENLELQTSGITRISVNNDNGNVGIGKINPSSKLDIEGSFSNGFSLKNVGGDYNGDGFEDYDNGALYTSYGDIEPQCSTLHFEEYDNPVIILGRQTKNQDSKDSLISMYDSNIGIGTIFPKSRLNIKIDNSIIGDGLIIEGTGNTHASPRLKLVDTRLGNVDTAPSWEIDNDNDYFRIFRQPNISTNGKTYLRVGKNGNFEIFGNVIISQKYFFSRNNDTIISFDNLLGNHYELDINGLDDGNWHCTSGNEICYNSHNSGEDAELQFNINDSPSYACILFHQEDDYPNYSKGIYYSTDAGNNCSVYGSASGFGQNFCFNIQKEGALTSPLYKNQSLGIICF